MKEIIVKMKTDRVKVTGCEYVRDLVRCEDCRHYQPINNGDHGWCGGVAKYPEQFCDEGEPIEGW